MTKTFYIPGTSCGIAARRQNPLARSGEGLYHRRGGPAQRDEGRSQMPARARLGGGLINFRYHAKIGSCPPPMLDRATGLRPGTSPMSQGTALKVPAAADGFGDESRANDL